VKAKASLHLNIVHKDKTKTEIIRKRTAKCAYVLQFSYLNPLTLSLFPQLIFATIIASDGVLEESPCPRGSSRTNLQVLVLVLVLGLQILKNFQRLSI